jgi:protein SCO1/2
MLSVFSNGRRLMAAAVSLAFAAALAGCGEKQAEFLGSDISGTHLGKDMALQDTDGKPHTLSDYKGKVVVVFFGYTQCPDVCPTSMATLGEAMEQLGDDAGKVQVLMISVDPERDTPEILKAYVSAFNPDFVGLRGTPDELSATAKSFKAYYAKVAGTAPGQYAMDHAASFYLFDKDGEVRALINSNAPAADIVHDIRQLL